IDDTELKLPKFPIPDKYDSSEEYLKALAWGGAKKRWNNITPEIEERLSYELDVIQREGFSDYFLIVWDLVRHARQSGALVGPGRGSTAGCAVAYCLGITQLDPLKYDLLFER